MPVGEGESPMEGTVSSVGESPSDSANVGANSSGPGPLSDEEFDEYADHEGIFEQPPVHPTESHPATNEDPGAETEDESEPIPELDPEVVADFQNLLRLGYLEEEFEWMGHNFVIHTLDTDTILEIGPMIKRYTATLAELKSYQVATVAACVISVDGKRLPIPLTDDEDDTPLRNRFNYVRKWFPPTHDAIYERYLLLEERVEEVMRAVGKAQGWTVSIPTSKEASV